MHCSDWLLLLHRAWYNTVSVFLWTHHVTVPSRFRCLGSRHPNPQTGYSTLTPAHCCVIYAQPLLIDNSCESDHPSKCAALWIFLFDSQVFRGWKAPPSCPLQCHSMTLYMCVSICVVASLKSSSSAHKLECWQASLSAACGCVWLCALRPCVTNTLISAVFLLWDHNQSV